METLVFHTILDTQLGQFFVCLVVTQDSEELTCHKIEMSNGVEVICPKEELDKETHDNLKNKLIHLLDKTME
jgi:hypothetical protein